MKKISLLLIAVLAFLMMDLKAQYITATTYPFSNSTGVLQDMSLW